MIADTATAVGVAFLVSLDDQNLGAFSSCEGLGVEVELESREEGGNNGFVWQLPTRLKYPNITLTRPLGSDTEKVAKWFAAFANGYTRCNGRIQAMTASGTGIATWSLTEVVPVRWTGPTFSAEHPTVLTETLELAHHGFTAAGS